MNKHQSLLLLTALLSLFFVQVRAEDDRNMLWEVEHDKSQLFILGSIHVANESLYPLDDEINRAFENADKLVLELDPLASGMKIMQMVLTESAVEKGETLKDLISQEAYDKLETYLKKRKISMSMFANRKPWYVSFLLPQFELQRLGFKAEHGIDLHFLMRARRRNMQVLELETPEQQLGIFTDMTEMQQEEFLMMTLKEMSEIKKMIDDIIKLWKAGNTKKLSELLFVQSDDHEIWRELEDRMFKDRNIKMVKKIEGYLKSGGSYFVVVGAGHLVGEDSIPKLLREQGYTVQQR